MSMAEPRPQVRILDLVRYYLYLGAIGFGGPAALCWLNGRRFLVAVAMGMLSPGPVVITATFVEGFWGSPVSTVGIFLPSFLLVLIVAPLLIRHRADPNAQGFVKGMAAVLRRVVALGTGVVSVRTASAVVRSGQSDSGATECRCSVSAHLHKQ